MCALILQSFFLGRTPSPLTSLRAPQSLSDSQFCCLDRFMINEMVLLSRLIQKLRRVYSLQVALQLKLIHSMQTNSTNLEQLAQLAIYSTNHQDKQQAEHALEEIILSIDPISNSLDQIFQEYSETVVLAIAAKMSQMVVRIESKLGFYLEKVNSILRRWFNPKDGKFTRQNGQPLEKYIVNTMSLFLGRSLKQLYQVKGNESSVKQWLVSPQQGDKYRLFLFLTFIENVSLIDGSLAFVTYKTLLQSFQEEIIPLILEAFYPHFINFSEDIEVEGLSDMQRRMNLEQQSLRQRQKGISGKSFNAFSFSIFTLLSEVVNFKFNLNYKEFDENDDNKGVTISFPESVIGQIIKKDFLEALYSIISRLLQIPSAEKYFLLCCQCLQKILSVKVCNMPYKSLPRFVWTNIFGIVRLLEMIVDQQRGNEKSLGKIVDCSLMFTEVFGMCEIKQLQMIDSRYSQYHQKFLSKVFTLPILLVNGKTLNAENELFLMVVKLMARVGSDISYLKIPHNPIFIDDCYNQFLKKFCNRFFTQSVVILGDVTFSSLDDFKKTIQSFFKNIIQICTSNYQLLFRGLKALLEGTSGDIQHQQINIANIFLFLSATFDSQCFYQGSITKKNIFQSKGGQFSYVADLNALAQLLVTIFNFIESYNSQYNNFSIYINNSLTLFFSSILSRFLSTAIVLQDNTQLHIQDKIFQLYKSCLNNFQDDQFILEGLIKLSNLIKKVEISSIQFIFQTLHQLISTIKHKFKKDAFKTTIVYKEMLFFFNTLVQQKLQPQVMKWRVLLFKSLSLLCFDDDLDDFRVNIRNAIMLIQKSGSDQMDRVLYDITGISEGIQSIQIFDYFLNKLMTEINYPQLLNNLFKVLGHRQALLKDILHMTCLLISNKQGNGHISKTYDIVIYSLPLWNLVLQKIYLNEEKIELHEQIYSIVKMLVQQGHINIAVLDERVPQDIRKFIFLTIDHLTFFLEHIENYPQHVRKFYDLIQQFFNKLKKLIYNNESSQLANKLTELLYSIMRRIVSQFQNVLNQSYNPLVFSLTINILDSFFKYLLQSKEIIHNKMFSEHLPSMFEIDDDKVKFIVDIFMLGLHFGSSKDNDLLRALTSIAMNLTLCYNFDMIYLADQIGVKNGNDKQQFKRVISYMKEGKQSQWIFYQLSDWFKKQDRFKENTDAANAIEQY